MEEGRTGGAFPLALDWTAAAAQAQAQALPRRARVLLDGDGRS